ncbi:hypothetical protein ACFLZ8_04290 [Planctomycetota bacterium]
MKNPQFNINSRLDMIEDALVQIKLLITLLIMLILLNFYGLMDPDERIIQIVLFIFIILSAGYLLTLWMQKLFCSKSGSNISEKQVQKILEDIENKE